MNSDAEKIKLHREILQGREKPESFEAVSLALSVRDNEDRDLCLLDTIQWLITNENWQQAYGTAQLISASYEKSEALQAVANYLASIGHLEKAFSIFDEAISPSLMQHFAEWQQAEILHKTAKSLRLIKASFKADEVWKKAIEIAQKGEESLNLQDSLDSSSVLAEIAENFAAEERFENALKTAQEIKNIGKRERVLLQISEYSERVKRVA